MLDRKEESVEEFEFGLHAEWKKMGLKKLQLVCGTDEEHSLRNPFKFFFSEGISVLCTQHLYDNAKRHLNEAKVDKAVVQELTDFVFSKGKHYEDGLISAKNEIEFLERKCKIHGLSKHFPGDKFDKLADNLLEYVVKPRMKSNGIPLSWKNNACKYSIFKNGKIDSEKILLFTYHYWN